MSVKEIEVGPGALLQLRGHRDIAATSWAHICSYCPSTAAIAGALRPYRFDRTSDTS
jgi:hypothetical protein